MILSLGIYQIQEELPLRAPRQHKAQFLSGMRFQGPENTDIFLTFMNLPLSESTLTVQGLERELLFSERSSVMPFGNIVCHQVYPLISWMVYSKSQNLLAAVLNRAAGLRGSRRSSESSDTRAAICLLLPTYTQLKIIIPKKKSKHLFGHLTCPQA